MRCFVALTTLLALSIFHTACTSKPQTSTVADAPTPANSIAESRVVCIDPGHPSEINSGRTLQNGTSEVHIAWVVGLKLKELLEAKGLRVVMTKPAEDQLVRNKERALIANDAGAMLMVRLHCDSSAGEGFAVYYPDRQATVDGLSGPPQEIITRSRLAARSMHEELEAALQGELKAGGVRGDSQTSVGSRQGALTGSIYSKVPVVTVEMVVLSNVSDAEFIKSETGQRKMAQAIANGVKRFVGPAAF
ncbi:MAG TPA: N-acetylmuramoyl-L-alanine amidase [Pyrinomonadaceae bacterium]|jgi:N-acetylmuramoyl-L-alanine amidase